LFLARFVQATILLDRSTFPKNKEVTKQVEKFRRKIEFDAERKVEEKSFYFQLENIIGKQININTSYLI